MFSLPNFGLPATHAGRTLASLAASSGVHVALLATLAVVVLRSHQTSEAPVSVVASLALSGEPGSPDGAPLDGSLAGATAPQQGAAAVSAADVVAPDARFPFPSFAPTEIDPAGLLPAEPSSLNQIQLLAVEESADNDPPAKDPKLAAVRGMAGGKGAGAGGDGGGGQGAGGHSFFGLEAAGEKIVFVVDISGSMSGHRFYRARNELRQSIESLRENQQFFVIFFNDSALPMPAEKLLPATRNNVSQTLQWLEYVQCGGGTNPLPGLLLALELHPDAIYLLTDGKFDPQVVWEVAQAEPVVPIPIYTISFASRSAEKLLKNIAKATGGIYRFVR